MGKLMSGIAVLLCLGATWAAAASESVVPFKANARVVVGTDGVPLEVVASQKLPEPIRRAMEARITQWRFEPLVIDGQPTMGTTYVFLDACAVQQQDGQLNLAMDYLRNGPGHADGELQHPAPAYPPDAARGGSVGSFVVILKVGTDGVATVESIERQAGSRKLFEPALRAWATTLQYAPEEVNGVPVATRIAIPVEFTLSQPTLRRTKRARQLAAVEGSNACATASRGGEQTNPVVLDSPFKLVGTEG